MTSNAISTGAAGGRSRQEQATPYAAAAETVMLPGVCCTRCADPNRRALDGSFLAPVGGPHGHCSDCGRPLYIGGSRDASRACSPCFQRALEMMARAYARERAKGGTR